MNKLHTVRFGEELHFEDSKLRGLRSFKPGNAWADTGLRTMYDRERERITTAFFKRVGLGMVLVP